MNPPVAVRSPEARKVSKRRDHFSTFLRRVRTLGGWLSEGKYKSGLSMGQYGPMCHGNRGFHGIYGNVFSVTYGLQRTGKSSIPTSRPNRK
jgi:hypothetical protein